MAKTDLVAGILFLIAALVILIVPLYLEPNPLALPAAVVTFVGAVTAVGGRARRRVALSIGIAGLVLNLLWFALATSGFGKGDPWLDDMMEAGVLAALFLAATVCLAAAGRGGRR